MIPLDLPPKPALWIPPALIIPGEAETLDRALMRAGVSRPIRRAVVRSLENFSGQPHTHLLARVARDRETKETSLPQLLALLATRRRQAAGGTILTGTPGGDFPDGGGNSAAFDSNTAQAAGICSVKGNAATATWYYLELDFGATKAVSNVMIWPSTDQGFVETVATFDWQVESWNGSGWDVEATNLAEADITSGSYEQAVSVSASKMRVGFRQNSGSPKNLYCSEVQFIGS